MSWRVQFHEEFLEEFSTFDAAVQEEMLALGRLLAHQGPQLRRPHCDTLNGSRFPNMKELRFSVSDGVWRVAFAFDPERSAILLVGGSKSGVSSNRFYRNLVRVADERFRSHLEQLDRR